MQTAYIDLTKRGRELVEEINQHMEKAMSECVSANDIAVGRFKLGGYYIYIDYSMPWSSAFPSSLSPVTITSAIEREYPRIEEYLAHHLPDWSEVMKKVEEDRREEMEFQDYLWRNCRW